MIDKMGATSRLTHHFSHQNGLANRKIVLAARIVWATQARRSGGQQEVTVQVIPDAVLWSTNDIA
jgi:hypothetical protein